MDSPKPQLHSLVDRVPAERVEEAIDCVRRLAEVDGRPEEGVLTALDRRPERRLVSGHEFRTSRRRSLKELAAEQGVRPIASLDDLRADFWPEDESIDDFLAAVREWRRNG